MKITEEELKQIIQEEIINEGFLDGAWAAIRETAISGIVGAIIGYFGWDKKHFMSSVIRESIANISFKEWQTIITNKDSRRCSVISDNVMEGVVEALAQKILGALTDSLESAVTGMSSVLSKTPQGMIASRVVTPAVFGISKQAIANIIKDLDIIKKNKEKLTGIICKEINKIDLKDFTGGAEKSISSFFS